MSERPASVATPVPIVVNGEQREVESAPERSLLHVLREEMGLRAAKYGCAEGACGACTVLVDGTPVRSCVADAAGFAGRDVTTLEGLADDRTRQALANAFLAESATQCGYCTPGMLVAATSLLRAHPDPTDRQIVEAMDGNVCRCGAYSRIVRAIRRAASGIEGDVVGAARSDRDPASAGPAIDEPAARPPRPWDLTPVEERDYFARLGDGLAVVLPPDEAERVNESSGGAWSASGGAWLHLAGDGRITAFTGKVEVGQGNRTALATLVAEELGASPRDVDLVMGDTDLCPFDLGTFGSRSVADAGSVLRVTAASARRWLLRAAAARWEIEPDDLQVAIGRVTTRDGSRTTGLGDLVHGERRVELARAEVAVRSPDAWSLAGRAADRPRGRVGDLSLVEGTARYTSDLERPGMLHGRVLRPPSIGARMISVDTSRAEAIESVVVVHDGSFVGVAAPDPNAAAQALAAIDVEWQEQPGPSDGEIVDYLRSHPSEAVGWEGAVDDQTGDVEAARPAAAVTIAATYTTSYIAHVPLETRVAVAEWEAGSRGRLTIWTGTQRPFSVRGDVANALGLDEADVRVVVPATGSGYGGKHHVSAAVEAARLARAAGRPVKVRWSRAEEFREAYFRPAAVIDVRSGADADGHLTSWEFTNTNSGPNAISTPYEVPNQRIRFQPASSPLPQASYRALAATANCFARESHMDELADRLGLDPLAFRLANLPDERLAHLFGVVAERIGWSAAETAKRDAVGFGIAGGIEKGGRVATSARVEAADGTPRITRIVTAYDCGAIVDPDNLVNQIEGATVMGLGGALFEAIRFADGRITNGSMTDYRVPRFSDVPPIEVILVDRPDEPSAGAGETPIIAVAPAIANAIFAATGRRIRSLPLLPEAAQVPSRSADPR